VPGTVAMKVFCRSTDRRCGDQSLSASLGKFNGTSTYEVFRRQGIEKIELRDEPAAPQR